LFVLVSKSKVILFGGATGDTGKYIITGDTYCLDLISNKWLKLEGTIYLSLEKDNFTFLRFGYCTISQSRSRKWSGGFAINGCLRRRDRR